MFSGVLSKSGSLCTQDDHPVSYLSSSQAGPSFPISSMTLGSVWFCHTLQSEILSNPLLFCHLLYLVSLFFCLFFMSVSRYEPIMDPLFLDPSYTWPYQWPFFSCGDTCLKNQRHHRCRCRRLPDQQQSNFFSLKIRIRPSLTCFTSLLTVCLWTRSFTLIKRFMIDLFCWSFLREDTVQMLI